MSRGLRPWDSVLSDSVLLVRGTGQGLGKALVEDDGGGDPEKAWVLLMSTTVTTRRRLRIAVYLVRRGGSIQTSFSATWAPGGEGGGIWVREVLDAALLTGQSAIAKAEECAQASARDAGRTLQAGAVSGDPDVRDCLLNPGPLLLLLEVMES